MRLVIADTGPINYLILTGHIEILSVLFEKVILPSTVRAELAAGKASLPVRNWLARLPEWVEVFPTPVGDDTDPLLKGIHAGERAAITLVGFSLWRRRGLEDVDVALKMRRLREWRADLNRVQANVQYGFVYVDQEGFEKYKPSCFRQLAEGFRQYQGRESEHSSRASEYPV